MNATLFATVMSINKFIDSHRDSLHLDVFFEFIKNNLNLFSATAYKKRLLDQGRDSEDCEHWVKLHTDITAAMVDQDKAKIESLPVHNLKVWRDKKLAHIERNLVTKNIDVMKVNPVTIQEID
jgi:N-dimethylarginine dimethylaminohydrolase